jgi:YfiH family protein
MPMPTMTWGERGRMVEGNRSFRWVAIESGRALLCEPLQVVAPHLFTTRDLACRAGAHDCTRAYAIVARALGVPSDRVRDARQVHGTNVFDRPNCRHGAVKANPERPEADILISSDPDEAIVVRVADCVPILLADRRSGAVAAVHAGWRGTCAGAAAIAVRALAEKYGTDPGHVVAAVGPSIGPCCYQVGAEVREAFARSPAVGERSGALFAPDGDRWKLDMWAANRQQLLDAGLLPEHVHLSGECTASHVDRYYSYRREGGAAGRLIAAIRASSEGDLRPLEQA